MKIRVRNTAQLPNRYVRFLKWKIYRLNRKFGTIHYADIFISKEGSNNAIYEIVLRLGLTGKDIIMKHKSRVISELINQTHKDAHRYLAEYKNR